MKQNLVIVIFLTLAICEFSLSIPTQLGDAVEEPIDKFFDAQRDVRFLLRTRANRNGPAERLLFNNLASVQQSSFDRNKPLRVLIHGWQEDETSDIKIETSAELLNYNDYNVIFVDWSEGSSTINYISAANRVVPVGVLIASYLDFLHQNGFISWNSVGLVGFSLGAHVAGHVGKNVRAGRINFIIGLDPAGPLFSVGNPAGRLDAGDADYVECIHTNGPTLLIVGAGIGAPIGHADFWPNGGRSQPGCFWNACSHGRAVEYYVESIQNNAFFALQCPSRDDINASRCNITPGAWMGGDGMNFNKSLRGSFYLDTNNASPFARGPARP
jgi:pancreatic triacylglycerol lipase